tara:strand:- start:1297 stop:2082 length:786 start_codon:yes stop_codon:yes gene_type:complete
MKYKLYHINSFVSNSLKGNPACVIFLDKWLKDSVMMRISKENNVAETAFFIFDNNKIMLRWFTPDIEIDLCGHATLAVAHVLRSILKYKNDKIIFHSKSGKLIVNFNKDIYYLNFPIRKAEISSLPIEIKLSLNIQPQEIYKARDFMLVYNSEEEVKNIIIDRSYFDKINLGYGGVIITAQGNNVDFVSRYFTPQATFLEDPVTGSAHCTLIPYWSSRLNKNKLKALQISSRGGSLICENNSDRVIIGGQAKTSFISEVKI